MRRNTAVINYSIKQECLFNALLTSCHQELLVECSTPPCSYRACGWSQQLAGFVCFKAVINQCSIKLNPHTVT